VRHRYYDTRALQKDFGKITDYAPPKKEHPGSIMAGKTRLAGHTATRLAGPTERRSRSPAQ
jgi:hypothetical protein